MAGMHREYRKFLLANIRPVPSKTERMLALADVHLQVTEINEIDLFRFSQKSEPAFYIAAFHLREEN